MLKFLRRFLTACLALLSLMFGYSYGAFADNLSTVMPSDDITGFDAIETIDVTPVKESSSDVFMTEASRSDSFAIESVPVTHEVVVHEVIPVAPVSVSAIVEEAVPVVELAAVEAVAEPEAKSLPEALAMSPAIEPASESMAESVAVETIDGTLAHGIAVEQDA
jgi:hypothetical protein